MLGSSWFLCHKLHDDAKDAKRRCVGLLLTSLAENAVKASDETEVIALYPV